MPTVRLSYRECWNGLLPRVCVKCGAAAADSLRFVIPTRFLFYVAVPIAILVPPLCVAAVLYLGRTRGMRVPMCDRHREEGARWDRVMGRSYLVVVGGAFTAAALLLAVVSSEQFDRVLELPPGGMGKWIVIPLAYYVVVVMTWAIPVSIRQTRYVRITQATARDIRLSGVHPGFVRAVWDDRARDPTRLALFGDARDDYDDER